ncbi:MAG: LytTR family transcriptional regulator [Clostridiales bacterium]|nr:LytTR family transcriptional regulator [Clostridiales bacterium]
MKITIVEDASLKELEVVIKCQAADEQVLKICAGLKGFEQKLTGMFDGQVHVVNPSDIFYVESVDRKTFIYATKRVYESALKLYEIEERLATHDFIRVSKSAVLNFDKVVSLRGDLGGRLILALSNGEKITASRQYAGDIKRKLGMGSGTGSSGGKK